MRLESSILSFSKSLIMFGVVALSFSIVIALLSFAIFVECSEKKFKSMRFKGGARLRMKPATLAKIVDSFMERYPIQVVWCKDRDEMRGKMCLWFLKEEELLENE